MNIVTGAVGSLIYKLGLLLNDEYKLQKNARAKLRSLIEELECAQAALCKVDGVPPEQLDEHVKIWAREVREASYDMEDVIDTFLVHVDGGHEEHSAGHENFFKRLGCLMPRKLLERHKVAVAVADINKRLEEITRRQGRYTVSDSITMARPVILDPRLAAIYKEESELVGIEQSRSELIAMLSPLRHDEWPEIEMKVVSVIGVGGLGKTTLAKAVYNKLRLDFECSAFVPVGRDPDLKKVLRDILIDIDKSKYMDPKMTILDERQLINELRENLKNKRYLLGIDDVWETETWETIKLALVQKKNGSRVITTTRNWKVAEQAGEIYKLEHLPFDKSEKLFYTRIFGAEGKCPNSELDEISDKILKKCGGVPLSIITMASLLMGKSKEEWIEVCSSIAFRDKDNKQVSDTEWILSLSYYDLPPPLKTCLLYLSAFPEDKIIDKEFLIQMWQAEGFIHNDRTETRSFEVGNRYFNELINRSMIQAVKSDEDDDVVIGCRVHDMVLDLLRLKSQEENFVTILSNNAAAFHHRKNNGELVKSPKKVRRLTNQNQYKIVEHRKKEMGHLRSFIAFSCGIAEGFSFGRCKLLRVLALEHCGAAVCGDQHFICLKHIGNLPHLRYFGLRYSFIEGIPEEIGALKFLQTLDLEGTMAVQEQLPSSVGLLAQLVFLNARCMKVPNGVIKKLTFLEQLKICADRNVVSLFKELCKLIELRKLYVDMGTLPQRVARKLFECLGNLPNIQHLQLNYKTHSLTRETLALPRSLRCLTLPSSSFSELPSCISPSSLPNLTNINLRVEYMEDQHVNILGQLSELRHLRLKITRECNVAKVTVSSTACTANGMFQKLRSLSLPYSSVQIVLNEDSSVLFMFNKKSRARYSRPTDFGIKKRKMCTVSPAVLMPNLQVLQFVVYVNSYGYNGICNNLGLECLPSLQTAKVCMIGLYGNVDSFFAHEVERQENACTRNLFCGYEVGRQEEAALIKAIEDHPNRPMLQLDTVEEEKYRPN